MKHLYIIIVIALLLSCGYEGPIEAPPPPTLIKAGVQVELLRGFSNANSDPRWEYKVIYDLAEGVYLTMKDKDDNAQARTLRQWYDEDHYSLNVQINKAITWLCNNGDLDPHEDSWVELTKGWTNNPLQITRVLSDQPEKYGYLTTVYKIVVVGLGDSALMRKPNMPKPALIADRWQ